MDFRLGGVAQLGERLPCTQEAIGSNPFTSTRKAVDWVGSMMGIVGRVESTGEWARGGSSLKTE